MTREKRSFVKRYITITLGAAVLLALLAVLRLCLSEKLETAEDRTAYLASLGWRCDAASEQYRAVRLPEDFTGVMADYAAMQRADGFSMEKYAGKVCSQYVYTLTEHPGSLTVYAVLYIYKGRVIGGDIHTAALDGYMHGLRSQR